MKMDRTKLMNSPIIKEVSLLDLIHLEIWPLTGFKRIFSEEMELPFKHK